MIDKINEIDKFLTGIYIITNTINNKCYVGQSVDVRCRLKGHYRDLTSGSHPNYLLQHAFNVYGESAFKVSVLYECKKEELNDFESHFCHQNNVWEKGYNIARMKPSNVRVKTKREKIRKEFVEYLCNLSGLIEVVNESPEDLMIDVWKIAESSGLEEKLLKWSINTLTPEELKQLPFAVNIESFGFEKVFVSFRSKKREEELRLSLWNQL